MIHYLKQVDQEETTTLSLQTLSGNQVIRIPEAKLLYFSVCELYIFYCAYKVSDYKIHLTLITSYMFSLGHSHRTISYLLKKSMYRFLHEHKFLFFWDERSRVQLLHSVPFYTPANTCNLVFPRPRQHLVLPVWFVLVPPRAVISLLFQLVSP